MRALAPLALALCSCTIAFPDKEQADTSVDPDAEDTPADSSPDAPGDTPVDPPPDTGTDTPADPEDETGCGNGVLEAELGEQCDEGTSGNCDTPGCTCSTGCRIQWVCEHDPGTIIRLNDVWTNGTDAVAVGTNGAALGRETTGVWTALDTTVAVDLEAIEAVTSSPVDLLVAGYDSTFLRYSSGSWAHETSITVPAGHDLTDLSCWWFSPIMCFFTTREGVILSRTGAWGQYPTPAVTQWNAVDSFQEGSDDPWGCAVGTSGQITFYIATPTPAHWTSVEYPNGSFPVYDVLVDHEGSAYVVADSGRIHHWDGREWDPMTTSTTERLYGIAGTGDMLFAVGDAGTILSLDTFTGDVWQSELSFTTNTLRAVAASPTMVVAVGDDGIVLRRPY
jgi:hypothetical protein